jgi:hypothetical protein
MIAHSSMAYVAGVSDGAQLIAIRQLPALPFCPNSGMDNWHLCAAVLAYLKAHPEKTDSPTRALYETRQEIIHEMCNQLANSDATA